MELLGVDDPNQVSKVRCLNPYYQRLHKKRNISGQIIATSHDLTPNGGLLREFPLFQGNLGW